MTGNQPVRSVAISCWGLMILAKTWLERDSNVSVGSSSVGGVSGVLVEWMFFLIFFMCPFSVAMEGGSCFTRSDIMFGQVVKWTFLVAWSKVLLTRMKSVACYHLARSGFLLAARALSAAGCFLLAVYLGCWLV